ncbi:MAG: alpha/beta fold hydrolase [Vicinamibacterales bacterium]
MATTTLNAITIDYDDHGAGGAAVLLVHGHPFNRSMWSPQVAALAAAGWRVIVPDLRGYGGTAVVPGMTTLDVFARDLVALLDHLRIDQVVAAGLSMGGQIVMELARLYPHRLRGVVLAATYPQAETEEGKGRRREMAARLEREGMAGYAAEVLPQMLSAGTIAAAPGTAAQVMAMMRGTSPQGAAAALRGRAERPDYAATLARLAVPALIVIGDEDVFTSRADADRMQALIAGSELVWMAGVGHMPNLERPDAFNQALVRFLAET